MKKISAFMAILLALLLLSGASTGAGQSMSVTDPRPAAPNIMSGGEYSLTSMTWCASASMTGDGYVLTSLTTPTSSEDACCCLFVPFTRR